MGTPPASLAPTPSPPPAFPMGNDSGAVLQRHLQRAEGGQVPGRARSIPAAATQALIRLPREVVESPSLEIFQTRLDKVLCSLLWVTLLGQGVGLGDPQRSLPTPTILQFCDSVNSVIPRHAGAYAGGSEGGRMPAKPFRVRGAVSMEN